MSSTGQAFVKAFARRNQSPATTNSAPASVGQPSQPPGAQIEVGEEIREIRVDTAANPLHARQTAVPDNDSQLADALQHQVQVSPISQAVVYQDLIETMTTADQTMADQPPADRMEAEDQAAAETPGADVPLNSEAEKLVGEATTAAASSLSHLSSRSALRPVWEVEVFDISTVVADLFFDEKLFQNLSEQMGAASDQGLHSMLITSSLPGEGRSTIAIGMALAAAASGRRVALVDGDLDQPTLADELNLELDFGWVDHFRGGLPLSEVSVYAVEDNLTFFPLMSTDPIDQPSHTECEQMIHKLKETFDLVVVDGPVAHVRAIQLIAPAIDSAVIVRDAKQSGGSTHQLTSLIRDSGIGGIGIVENFT